MLEARELKTMLEGLFADSEMSKEQVRKIKEEIEKELCYGIGHTIEFTEEALERAFGDESINVAETEEELKNLKEEKEKLENMLCIAYKLIEIIDLRIDVIKDLAENLENIEKHNPEEQNNVSFEIEYIAKKTLELEALTNNLI